MISFVTANWQWILTALVIFAVIVYILPMVVLGKWSKLREKAYMAMCIAEKNIVGTKQGKARFKEVFDQIYNAIPWWIRIFISEKGLKKQLQKLYDNVKDKLDNGKVDDSIHKKKPPGDTVIDKEQ